MAEIRAEIARLSDRQALGVLDALAAEYAGDDVPETTAEQSEALAELFGEGGSVPEPSAVDPSAAAEAARALLGVLAGVPEVAPRLAELVARPPAQESAAIPLVLAAPVVFTGCIVALQVAGHIEFSRGPDGRWRVKYDPKHETPLDKSMKDLIATLKGIMLHFGPK